MAFVLASESTRIEICQEQPMLPVGDRRDSPEAVGLRAQGSGLRALWGLSSPAESSGLRRKSSRHQDVRCHLETKNTFT